MAFINKKEILEAAEKAKVERQHSALEAMRREIDEYLQNLLAEANRGADLPVHPMKLPEFFSKFPQEIFNDLDEAGYEVKISQDQSEYVIC